MPYTLPSYFVPDFFSFRPEPYFLFFFSRLSFFYERRWKLVITQLRTLLKSLIQKGKGLWAGKYYYSYLYNFVPLRSHIEKPGFNNNIIIYFSLTFINNFYKFSYIAGKLWQEYCKISCQRLSVWVNLTSWWFGKVWHYWCTSLAVQVYFSICSYHVLSSQSFAS